MPPNSDLVRLFILSNSLKNHSLKRNTSGSTKIIYDFKSLAKKVFVDGDIKKETTDLWLINNKVKGKVVGGLGIIGPIRMPKR